MKSTNNPGPNGTKNPDQLEHEAADARHNVDRTLSALEQKLSPGQLLDQSMNLMREHGGEFTGNLGRTVKQNPVPLLLTSVGLAWLMSSTSQPKGFGSSDHLPVPRNQAGAGYPASHTSANGTASMKDKAGSMASSAQGRAEEARNQLSEGARHKAQSAREMQHEASQYASMQAHKMGDQFNSLLHEQPLVLGGLAVALGAALGAALPRTQQENEVLGEKRDEVVDRGRQEASRKYDAMRDEVKENAEDLSQDLKKRVDSKSDSRPRQI